MPTYDYRCDDCGLEFEYLQSMVDDPLEECPRCGGRVRRLIGAGAGLIFKGSGFYTTDYKKDRTVGSGKEGSGKKEAAETGGESGETNEEKESDNVRL